MPTIGPYGWVGGFNANALAYEIAKDQMCDGQDTQVVYGALQKRSGSVNVNTNALNSSAVITGIYDWLISGVRTQVIVAGSKVYKTANLGASPSDITGSATITAGQNNQHTFASLNNILAIFGGTTPDTPLQWTGSGNVSALAGSPPAGNLGATANNFMFISGIAATPSRVAWSNVSDPNTWTASNVIDFRPGDGDTITAIAEFNQNLVIFKRRSMGMLYTQTITASGAVTLGPLSQLPSYVGCAGSQAFDHLPDGRIVFLGSNGHAYIFDGSLTDISDEPYPTCSMQTLFDAIVPGRLPFACVQVYPTKHQVWFSVSTNSSSTNNTIYLYDYINEVWQPPFTNINANILEAVIDTRGTPSHAVVMCTGSYGGFVIEQDKGTTNVESSNTAIDGYGSVCVTFGPELTTFEPKSIIVPFQAQSVPCLTQINYGVNGFTETGSSYQVNMQQTGGFLDTSFVLDSSPLAGNSVQRVVIPVQTNARCYSLTVQVRNQNASQPFTVHPIFISDEVLT